MFSTNFLTDLARKYELSPEQKEVFLLWFDDDKADREISEQLHVTAEAIRNRKTGIYKKFSIAGSGANKAIKLRNWLEAEAKKQNIQVDDLESLVKEVKQKIAADVTERCGTMRVLDMTQVLDRIYTDVNILKDVIGRRRIGYDEVIEVCTREYFDRFLVGTIQERVAGLDAVEEFQKLVVLGKPGAGKTTFMKYLAMSCLGNRFHGELVPIFVTLKAYAEKKGQPSLENYILTEFQKRDVAGDAVQRLLKDGRALILLDGLDEVKKEDDRRVKEDIDQFSRDWLKNRFAITCRIAAREYKFDNFIDVEVADFDDEQIAIFVNNWFREKDSTKAARLIEKLQNNEPVKELAKTPLLLTLLCLVFGERNDLPPKRSELYKEGLEVLMKRWDADRNIEREMIYKHLSPQNKEDMLGQIALNTFVNSEYFFRQEDLQRQINDYICNLPEASADPEALRLDSEVVLKAIEHHHGLLVERARNIYSFSHLTFQEYFAAREIDRERQLEMLVQNVFNPKWKEVFLLTAEMLRRSDCFLQLMKEKIDEMLIGYEKNNKEDYEKLQSFLLWVKQKSDSFQAKYKVFAVRAFYSDINYYGLGLARELDSTFAKDLDETHKSISGFLKKHSKDDVKVLDNAIENTVNQELVIDINIALDLALIRTLAHTGNLAFEFESECVILSAINLSCALVLTCHMGDDIILKQELQGLRDRLPDHNEEDITLFEWWKTNGVKWNSDLRKVCIERRNISKDWQLTDEQQKLREKYYEANLLLVECMNRSYVSKQVREEIEATMLLPSKK